MLGREYIGFWYASKNSDQGGYTNMMTLYEQDYALWSEKMADLIANKRFDELDIENLVEEVRDNPEGKTKYY